MPEYSIFDSFGDYEKDVAEILLQVPELIMEFSDLRRRLPFFWGSKRKRAAINLTPSPSPPPSPPIHTVPFLPTLSCNGERPIINADPLRTATPLSFSPTESDAKPMQPKRKSSKKMTKAELLEKLTELTQRRDVLQGEVENVKGYYKKLKALNYELKARQRELGLNKAVPDFGGDWKLRPKVTESTVQLANFGGQDHQQHPIIAHQPPLVIDQTAQGHDIFGKFQNQYSQRAPLSHQPQLVIDQRAHGPRIFENFQYSYSQTPTLAGSSVGMGKREHLRPLAVPNLGFSSKEAFGMGFFQPPSLFKQ